MTRGELIDLLRRALERARLDGEGVAPGGDFVGHEHGLVSGIVARDQDGAKFYIGVWPAAEGDPGAHADREG